MLHRTVLISSYQESIAKLILDNSFTAFSILKKILYFKLPGKFTMSSRLKGSVSTIICSHLLIECTVQVGKRKIGGKG